MRKINLFYWLRRFAGWAHRRRQKRAAPPPRPHSPYRRFFTRDRSFAELTGRKK